MPGAPRPEQEQAPATAAAGDLAARLTALDAEVDPLARARAATVWLAMLDEHRDGVIELRRRAVVAAGLPARRLAGELGLSVGTASDLLRAGRGRGRRASRDSAAGRRVGQLREG